MVSCLLAVAMIMTLLPMSVFAATKFTLTVSSEKSNPKPGDTVEFAVTVDAIDSASDFGGFEFVLDIPAGLTYVSNSGGIVEGFKTTSGTTAECSFTEISKKVIVAAEDGFTNLSGLKVVTFSCSVNSDAIGEKIVNLRDVQVTNKSFDPLDDSQISVISASVTIPKAPISSVTASVEKPVAGKALDTSVDIGTASGYTGAVEWYEGDSATGTVATGKAKANTKYTAKITLTAGSGESFADSVTIPADYTKDSSSTSNKLVLTRTFDETGSLPAASVTDAPKANTGLKYNGGEQDLLGFVGTANGGTMQYSLDNSNWSTAIPKGKNAGDYTVYYKAVGDGGHSDSAVAHISAKIEPKDISGVTSVSIVDQPYTGSAITPDPEVKDGGTTLVKGKDYTVASSSKYVGTATLTITGKGNYTGTKDANFAITAVYQNPSFTTPVDLATGGARLDLRTLVQNAKGDMIFTITSGNAAILSGHELTSTGTTGVVKIKVSIAAKDMNGDTINEYNAFSKSEAITVNVINKTTNTTAMKVSQGDITYGETVSPSVDNKPADAGEVSYTYEVFDGTTYNSTTAPTNVGKYKVKAKCESSTTIYTAEDDFEILPKSISGMTVNLNKTTTVYDGNTQTVTVTGVGSLTAADYDVTSGTSDENVGNYTVKVTGKGNYEGTATATWEITPATLTVTPVANQSKKFKEADPALTYNCSGNVSGQIPAFGGKLNRAEGEGAGMYAIELGDLALKDNGTFKASNYELKMASPAVKFEIKKADALTLEDITLNQKCNVTTEQSKDIGTAGMPADAGALTYGKGTEGKTGSVAIDSWNVDPTTGKVTYKLSNGAVGDTVTLPVTIKSTNYADSTVNVVITLIKGSSGGYYYAPTTAVVPDMPMLYRGCTGDAVKTLQDKLNALGYNSGNVDGIFGAKTYAAVTAFQKANSLGVDGIVGKLTWGKLYGVSPAMPVETTTVVGRPMVSYGSRGDAVRKLQELLNALGYDCGSVDGIFGSKTKAAVLAFQKANGLGVDGIVGPLTWAKLG